MYFTDDLHLWIFCATDVTNLVKVSHELSESLMYRALRDDLHLLIFCATDVDVSITSADVSESLSRT